MENLCKNIVKMRCFKRSPFYWKLVTILATLNVVFLFYNNMLTRECIQIEASKKSGEVSLPQIKEVHSSLGFSLASSVINKCKTYTQPYRDEKHIPFWIHRMEMMSGNKSLYCPVEKVGTTFWRRVVYQTGHKSEIKHPYEVSISQALLQHFIHPSSNHTFDSVKSEFKFFFVRNPFHRILSAYIDKIFVPNPQFWDQFGKPSIQLFRKESNRSCYHDASFPEFVQFVIWSVKHFRQVDPHFLPATEMCVPCTMNFSFVGKMESFSEDIFPVFEKLHLSNAIPYLKDGLKEMAVFDALQDSIFSPYSWRTAILKCMSWHEALQRIWRKLQMRGLIDMDQKFPLTRYSSFRISKEMFLEAAKSAWRNSDSSKLKKQKREVFIEMYRSVPTAILNEFTSMFELDFHLYEYDTDPKEIFDRSMPFTKRNYAHFSR